jgi:serine-type D-Ala-D-Ala carboxypeptidase (penicillin-binding protein 5/6)
MPATPPNPFKHRKATFPRVLPILAALMLGSCGDPEKEARLQWREEEVNAKEQDLIRREQKMKEERAAVDILQNQINQEKQGIEAIRAQVTAELEKTARARRALEIKQLRGPVPSITAERVIVIDVDSNDVLWEKNADKKGPIASTQKLLTALVIAEAGDLDSKVTVELSDTQCAPVRIGLKPGEQYTRKQLLTALMVKSSNDIAQALARDNAGTVEAFMKKMNARALALGLQNSFFVNPHGLPAEVEQFSTARDLSVIALAADKRPEIREMVSLKSFKFEKADGKSEVLENTNRVLKSNAYCDGMKTGFTSAAGYCLVASGQKNGKRRIVIVLNGTSNGVWKDADALLVWAMKA